MKIRFFLCAMVLLFGFVAAGSAEEASAEYSGFMKAAAAANMSMQKAVVSDLPTAVTNAADLQATFAKVEAFWTMRGTADAVGFAKTIQAVAKEVHDAAAAGNGEAAQAAAKKIGASCGGCHMAHRDRAADGTFSIK